MESAPFRRLLVAVVAALVVVVSGCGDSDREPRSEPRDTPSADTIGAVREAVARVDVESGSARQIGTGRIWMIRFEITDYDDDLAKVRASADHDALALLDAVNEASPLASRISIDGTLPIMDRYGNTKVRRVYWAVFERETLTRINWDVVETLDVEAVADLYVLKPGL